MKKRYYFIAILLVIAFISLFVWKNKCPFCNAVFYAQECGMTNKLEFSTNWFVCKNCKEVYAKKLNGDFEKGVVINGEIYSQKEFQADLDSQRKLLQQIKVETIKNF